MSKRRSLLFFSPCMPNPRGTGWEQRAYSLLLGYSRCLDVDVWFMPTVDNPDLKRIGPLVEIARSANVFYPCALDDPGFGLQQRLMAQLGSADLVHVSRQPQLAANVAHARIVWDIDELPWSAAMPNASAKRDAAAVAQPAYARAASRSSVVLACSALEHLQHARRFVVVPNIVPPVGSGAGADEAASAASTLLFVGNLNYLPNLDALGFFQTQMLPGLTAVVPDAKIIVVGRAPATDQARAAIDRLRRSPQFEFAFDVPDCSPYYRRCAASIAPIRIGGGTRIKIVESFAHRRPVVSTSKGCEGLEVTHDRELLIADEPQAFVGHCVDLLRDAALRDRLAAAGYDLYEQRHTQAVVDAVLAQVVASVIAA